MGIYKLTRDERVRREIKGILRLRSGQEAGLGLYIAKSIVSAPRTKASLVQGGPGGTIWAESSGEGRGSRFYVKLRRV